MRVASDSQASFRTVERDERIGKLACDLKRRRSGWKEARIPVDLNPWNVNEPYVEGTQIVRPSYLTRPELRLADDGQLRYRRQHSGHTVVVSFQMLHPLKIIYRKFGGRPDAFSRKFEIISPRIISRGRFHCGKYAVPWVCLRMVTGGPARVICCQGRAWRDGREIRGWSERVAEACKVFEGTWLDAAADSRVPRIPQRTHW